jgi:hypothetical protein
VKPGDDLPVGVWVHGGVSSNSLISRRQSYLIPNCC